MQSHNNNSNNSNIPQDDSWMTQYDFNGSRNSQLGQSQYYYPNHSQGPDFLSGDNAVNYNASSFAGRPTIAQGFSSTNSGQTMTPPSSSSSGTVVRGLGTTPNDTNSTNSKNYNYTNGVNTEQYQDPHRYAYNQNPPSQSLAPPPYSNSNFFTSQSPPNMSYPQTMQQQQYQQQQYQQQQQPFQPVPGNYGPQNTYNNNINIGSSNQYSPYHGSGPNQYRSAFSPVTPTSTYNNHNQNNTMQNIPQQQRMISSQIPPVRSKRSFVKIVILGDSGVGKTSLMNRYHSNKFTGQYKATIGADFLSKEITIPPSTVQSPQQQFQPQQPQVVTLQIWDTAGQERFQSLGTSFYRGSNACVLVYDVTDPKSFEHLQRWRDEFMKQLGIGNSNEEFPFILLGNKVDRESSHERRVMKQSAEQWCHQNGRISYFETSAKSAVNVQDAFQKVAIMALTYVDKKRMMEPPTPHMSYMPNQPVDLNRGGFYRDDSNIKNGGDCC